MIMRLTIAKVVEDAMKQRNVSRKMTLKKLWGNMNGRIHEPHATISSGKKGYTIALRTGSGMPECEKIIGSIEHFYGHLEIKASGNIGLCSIEYKEAVADRADEIKAFCGLIIN